MKIYEQVFPEFGEESGKKALKLNNHLAENRYLV